MRQLVSPGVSYGSGGGMDCFNLPTNARRGSVSASIIPMPAGHRSQPTDAPGRSFTGSMTAVTAMFPAGRLDAARFAEDDTVALGRGSCAAVRAVRDTTTDVLVAIKSVAPDAPELRREVDVARVYKDLEIAGVECCGIVRPLGFVAEDCGRIGLVMECMAGSLAVDAPCPEPVVAAVLLMACDGLHTLHTALRVVHRDLKPSNLLFDTAGVVKVADFGCAGPPESRDFVGALPNMAPERLRNDAYGENSDVWALGLVAVELLLGRHPVRAAVGDGDTTERFWRLMELLCVSQPLDVQRGAVAAVVLRDVSEASSEFRDFVAQCLEPDAAARCGVEDLLAHPFVANAGGPEVLKGWLKSQRVL